jgi:rare lipoprotein A
MDSMMKVGLQRKGSSMHSIARKSMHGIAAENCPHTCLGKATALIIAATLTLLATGCHHQRQQAYAPPPPPLRTYPSHPRTESNENSAAIPRAPRGPIAEPEGKPILDETGMASWYGPSGRRAADGSAYDGTGMTAANKTLPLGTVARVTNLANGESVVVRITDRGPFAHGRILDLSESAAKQIDLYRMGVAKVRIEAFANPAASPTGRWCVQTGAFKNEQDALDLKSALLKRYVGSRVIEFPGDTGYWVRIDPPRHDHADAAAIMEWIGNPDPQAVPYLVRVD